MTGEKAKAGRQCDGPHKINSLLSSSSSDCVGKVISEKIGRGIRKK